MFGFKKTDKNAKLNQAREAILDSLLTYSPEDEEYYHLITSLERLDDLEANKSSYRPSADVIAAGVFNLSIAAMIMMWETKHIWGSKAADFIKKPK